MLLPEDYRNDEGILICGVCGKPKEVKFDLMGFERIVPCLCDCGAAERERKDAEWAEKQKMIRINDMRIENIRDKERRQCRFENAEMNGMLRLCRKYVDKWDEMYEKNVGILMYGPCGNGKSFSAACIANALIDKGVPALMTSFPAILDDTSNTIDIARQMQKYDLVILDDLGAERQSQYALEKVFYIVDERYKSGKPLIVTTNQQLEKMKEYAKEGEADYKRIYDRILEMCAPMAFKAESRRVAKKIEKAQALREALA